MSKQAWPYKTPAGRWAGFGPYYAMFPVAFAKQVVETMCPKDGAVLDPFCGRGTTPFVAQVTGRRATGMDINPVAWVFAKVKTTPEPCIERLLCRLDEVHRASTSRDGNPQNEFQKWAWSPGVLRFLNAARRMLDWREDKLDRTLMGFILVSLHDKRGHGISNQMLKARALGPGYSVRWWKNRKMRPPNIDPIVFFSGRIAWRYRHGTVRNRASVKVHLEDAESFLARKTAKRFDLLLTSPPYFNITNYRQDSWIRLWMLGEGPAWPDWSTDKNTYRRDLYQQMIENVFCNAGRLLKPHGVVWVRTDAREFTQKTTLKAIRSRWPGRKLYVRFDRPKHPTQTAHFGDTSLKPGEVDFLIPGGRKIPRGFKPHPLTTTSRG